ncbi:MAG: BT4734/BF3469 family protein [Verrucomicrobiota bacterium]
MNLFLDEKISFGLDVRKPDRLGTCSTNAVLCGIRDGTWRLSVSRVRSLPSDSPEQKAAKLNLPFATWAGEFSRRSNAALIRHSGQIGIDLDNLSEAQAVVAIQTAVADKYCLAAFRSVRGEGVRLLFRVPACNAQTHPVVFQQVSEYVHRIYGLAPDESGKDVSRASFVSFDSGLWFFAAALPLPIVLPVTHSGIGVNTRCVSPASFYSGQLAEIWPTYYGRTLANTMPREDGTVPTHRSLLDLGKSLAIHAEKIRSPLTTRQRDEALAAWLAELNRKGVSLRGDVVEYRNELQVSIQGAQIKPWFKKAVEKWLRWTRHNDFPHAGLPHEKILFAIRKHCQESNTDEFFLGVRDAGLVGGVSYKTGSRILRKLIASGDIEKLPGKRLLRHAQTFRLKIKSVIL